MAFKFNISLMSPKAAGIMQTTILETVLNLNPTK